MSQNQTAVNHSGKEGGDSEGLELIWGWRKGVFGIDYHDLAFPIGLRRNGELRLARAELRMRYNEGKRRIRQRW